MKVKAKPAGRASSPRARPTKAKESISSPAFTNEEVEEIRRLKAMPDSAIDYSEIPPLDFSAPRWRDSRLYRPVKVQKTFRVDADVLQAFSETGKGYMTLINSVLREYVDFSSDVVLKEVRARVAKQDYAGIAHIVKGALALRPDLQSYLPVKVRAAILHQWLAGNRVAGSGAGLAPLLEEIGRDPGWWSAILKAETDPARLPKALRLAKRNVEQLLAGNSVVA
jgi:uncharacterized protein (DUF4415 family)